MTAFDISHGVGGLFEAHQWNGGIFLNKLDQVDEEFLPIRDYIMFRRISGLHALADKPDPRSPKVARIGENAYPRSAGGVTVVYQDMEIRATTVRSLRAQRTALLAAFADTTAEGYMDVIPHADVGGPTARFYGMPLDLSIDDEIVSPWGFKSPQFPLGIRLSDPRKYYPSLAVSETGNPAAVTNPGDAPADPVITVAGASGTVTVSDGTRTLTFQNCPSGSLVIDFANRTAKVGAAHVELVAASSDWWDRFVHGIAGGATVSIAQTGGSGVTVQFTPATWG